MAEDEDGVSNRKSTQNLNNEPSPGPSEQNTQKPDLGIEIAKYNSNENGDNNFTEPKSSTSKSGGAIRKEENPFSFRHFLKRDLSLPGNSTYENTGARPKVYANTVQHSPNKSEFHTEPRREKTRSMEPQAKDKSRDGSGHHLSDNTASSSSVEIPFSVVDNSESKSNLYTDSSDTPFYHRPNLASEPLGMPSLPDFVQDHILVEQAYLNSNGPISVDLDNLPDFTFNTSYNAGSSSWGRQNTNRNINYDYDLYMREGSSSQKADRNIPLDLPVGAEAAGPLPLDLPPHINLDLTESVNTADRRNNSPRSSFPLDLPPNAGAESMRLPDFLPVHPGRTSPEPEHQDEQLNQILNELERTRSELLTERARRSRAESELSSTRATLERTRGELARARGEAARPPPPPPPPCTHQHPHPRPAASGTHYDDTIGETDDAAEENLLGTASRGTEAETTIIKLKNQIKKLKEELATTRAQCASSRSLQAAAARDFRHASRVAETSLRELLAGLEQLKTLSATLEPT